MFHSVEEASLEQKLENLSVLLVEDFDSIRAAVRLQLESLGLKVSEACHGVEALQALNQHNFDAVISDLVMPEMDGFELLEEIRRRPALRDMTVIIMSSHRDARYVIRALRLGADDYLVKPSSCELMGKVLGRAMSRVETG